jgi:hypothetical protein
MSAFMHSAVSFGTPDMPPLGLGSSIIGPISLHNAIGTHSPEILVSTPAGCAGEEDGAVGLEGIRLEARVIQEAPQLVWVEKFDATGG